MSRRSVWGVLGLLVSCVAAGPATRPVSGTLLDPAGVPAAGARVLLVRPGRVENLIDGHFEEDADAVATTADAHGHFAFAAPPWENGAVLATPPGGFVAAAVLDAATPLRATAYATVEGTLHVRDHAGASDLVQAWTATPAGACVGLGVCSNTVTADSAGHYRASVVPGDLVVGRAERTRSTRLVAGVLISRQEELPCGAGRTVRRDLGGGGRLVRLRAVGPTGGPVADRIITLIPVMPKIVDPRPDWPVDSTTWDAAKQAAFVKAFEASPEHKAAVEAADRQHRDFGRRIVHGFTDVDGRVTLPDVPADHYYIDLTATMTDADGRKRVIAVQQDQREVPPGDAQAAVDWPDLVLTPDPQARPGDPVPRFDFPLLDGGRVTSDDYRGRWVLIHAWASWCGPCRGQTPQLKDLAAKYAADRRFVVLCVSSDETADDARRYVHAEGLPGVQAFVGPWLGDDGGPFEPTIRALGATGIPRNVLVGPDGRVIEVGFDWDPIAAAVDAALKH